MQRASEQTYVSSLTLQPNINELSASIHASGLLQAFSLSLSRSWQVHEWSSRRKSRAFLARPLTLSCDHFVGQPMLRTLLHHFEPAGCMQLVDHPHTLRRHSSDLALARGDLIGSSEFTPSQSRRRAVTFTTASLSLDSAFNFSSNDHRIMIRPRDHCVSDGIEFMYPLSYCRLLKIFCLLN